MPFYYVTFHMPIFTFIVVVFQFFTRLYQLHKYVPLVSMLETYCTACEEVSSKTFDRIGGSKATNKPFVVTMSVVRSTMDMGVGHVLSAYIYEICIMVSSNNEIIPGMTIGPGNLNRFIIINPGHRAFESRNPGAMYVSLSRAKTSGTATELADFAFHSNELLNHDRVCHKPCTPLLLARDKEVARLQKTSATTMGMFPHLRKENPFLNKLPHAASQSSERVTTRPTPSTIHSTLRNNFTTPQICYSLDPSSSRPLGRCSSSQNTSKGFRGR